jgi:hypothetical protein
MTPGRSLAVFKDPAGIWMDYRNSELGAAGVDPSYERHVREAPAAPEISRAVAPQRL